MKILLTWVGPWLDKGEAAMIISTERAIKDRISNAELTILTAFPPKEIDIQKYSEYGVKVLPGLLSNYYSIQPRLNFLKYKVLKAIAIAPIVFVLMSKNIIWIYFYRYFDADVSFLLKDNRDSVKEYVDADWIIFTGGQYITDFGIGLFIAIYEIVISKLLKKPVMIWANSLGPFSSKYVRPFIKLALNRVELITTREATSREILNDIGVIAPTFVTADAAFILPAISRNEAMALIEDDARYSGSDINVGVTVITWSFPNEKGDANKLFENYLNSIADAIDYLIKKFNAHIFFFPQVLLPPMKDDRPISMKVLSKVKTKSNVVVLTKDYSPEQIKGMYGCMDLLIGTRFHSCILAQSMNVPTIAIEYDGHKSLGIMKLLALEEYVCNIKTLTSYELISKIDKMLSERVEIRKKLEKNIKVMEAKSKENMQLALEYLCPQN